MMKKILILITFLLYCNSPTKELKAGKLIDLSGSEWFISFEDNPEFAKPEFNSSAWETVDIPGNIRNFDSSSRGIFWLIRNFDLFEANFANTQALNLGKIYDRDEVYLNGVLIGINGKSPSDLVQNEVAYGRPRVYAIPPRILKQGTNRIAIKINSNFRSYGGVVVGMVGISSLELATNSILQNSLDDAIYEFIYLFVGIFFIISYIKLKELKEYLYFSIFLISFALFQFTRNEFRFGIGNYFLVFKFLENLILLNMPFFYTLFFQEFFKLPKLKYQNYYFVFNALLSLLLFIPNYVFWTDLLSIWSFNIILVLGYSLYISLNKAMEKPYSNNWEAILYSFALFIFIINVFWEILFQRGFITTDSGIENSVLFYILVVTVCLRLKFILLKVKIQKRFEQLKEIDMLREKIFLYMDRILSGVIDESIMITRALKNNLNPQSTVETVSKVQFNYAEIQLALDDILELSRLEVMSEPASKETVNFNDFITVILSLAKITYTIRVNEKFEIYNSLDLINSLIIRLIDFSGFKDISSNDLIVTSDLRNHLHFRFMLYSNNYSKTQKLYKQLNDYQKGKNIHTVRWAIIKELLRLLDGNLEMKLINKKFLRIDFSLKALPIEKDDSIQIPKIPKLNLNQLKNLKLNEIKWKFPKFKK